MRILITGTRYWSWELEKAVEHALETIEEINDCAVVVMHGGAPGADRVAADWAERHGRQVEKYFADWSRGRRAGPERNQRMVDAGADMCLAFPGPSSVGTWDCVRRARAADIPVEVFEVGGE